MSVDEPRKEIRRDELLKLGGIGALAVVSALFADADTAAASEKRKRPPKKPRRIFNNNPIGLDFTSSDSLSAKGGKKAYRCLVTSSEADTHQPRDADHVYTIATPHYGGHDLDNYTENDDIEYTIYVAIWDKK